jgi:hypothetical protein
MKPKRLVVIFAEESIPLTRAALTVAMRSTFPWHEIFSLNTLVGKVRDYVAQARRRRMPRCRVAVNVYTPFGALAVMISGPMMGFPRRGSIESPRGGSQLRPV